MKNGAIPGVTTRTQFSQPIDVDVLLDGRHRRNLEPQMTLMGHSIPANRRDQLLLERAQVTALIEMH